MYADIVFKLPLNQKYTYKIDGFNCDVGFRVKAKLGSTIKTGYIIDVYKNLKSDVNFEIKSILDVIDDKKIFTNYQIELAEKISNMYYCSLGEALFLMVPTSESELKRVKSLEINEIEYNKKELTNEQSLAVKSFLESNDNFFYLYGMTGSGKTEVYLTIAEDIIQKKQKVLYLVPEISLTHQISQEMHSRFGDRISIIHSGLSAAMKLKEWKKIINDEIDIVIGARSAIFAPLDNLGLIIIDEEHERTYKSDTTPRYHTRQIAMMLCAINRKKKNLNTKLLMGSATPSVEAYHLMQKGVIKKLFLSKRVAGGDLPSFKVVDMKNSSSIFSDYLIEKILETKRENKQTILFLNRKGFSYYYSCRDCGYEEKCKNCSVDLTYYKKKNRLYCHYCGYSKALEKKCPNCNSINVGFSGFGTEKIEENLEKLFPSFRIIRVDSESVKNKKKLIKILDEVKNGDWDIVIGTQMIAKGLNFPKVKLIGILNADMGLNIPDFRASERVYSLITQVAGRAGRYNPDGEVVIQTSKEDNEAINCAIKNLSNQFYENELKTREMCNFPPFSRLIRVVFRGKKLNDVMQEANKLKILLSEQGLTFLGPSDCPLSYLMDKYRVHILIRSNSFKIDHLKFKNALDKMEKNPKVYMEIDVDPLSLM